MFFSPRSQLGVSRTNVHPRLMRSHCSGHAKPMCALASRIVRARPVTVTFLSPQTIYPQMAKEIASHFDEHETDYHGRIRFVLDSP